MALDRREGRDVVRAHRDPHEAVRQAIEIDDDGLLLFLAFGLVVFLVLVLFALRVVFLFLSLVGLLLLDLDLIALRREERLHIPAQSQGIDSVPLVTGIVPFEVGDLRHIVTLRNEEQIVAFGAPDRRVGVEEIRGDLPRFAARNAPDKDPGHAGLVVEAEREVTAVGRPFVVEYSPEDVICHLDFSAVGHRHHEELAVLVRKRDACVVRRPERVAELSCMAAANFRGLALARLIGDPDLVLSAGIGDVGDALAVGRPGGGAIVRPRAASEVAGRALFDRHGEDLAAGCHDRPFTLR